MTRNTPRPPRYTRMQKKKKKNAQTRLFFLLFFLSFFSFCIWKKYRTKNAIFGIENDLSLCYSEVLGSILYYPRSIIQVLYKYRVRRRAHRACCFRGDLKTVLTRFALALQFACIVSFVWRPCPLSYSCRPGRCDTEGREWGGRAGGEALVLRFAGGSARGGCFSFSHECYFCFFVVVWFDTAPMRRDVANWYDVVRTGKDDFVMSVKVNKLL